jgi:hypothetical protein
MAKASASREPPQEVTVVQFSDAGVRLKTGTYASAILHEYGIAEIRGTESRVKLTVLGA